MFVFALKVLLSPPAQFLFLKPFLQRPFASCWVNIMEAFEGNKGNKRIGKLARELCQKRSFDAGSQKRTRILLAHACLVWQSVTTDLSHGYRYRRCSKRKPLQTYKTRFGGFTMISLLCRVFSTTSLLHPSKCRSRSTAHAAQPPHS